MAGTILDTITEQYNTLTRSGKKLANYLFSNAGEAQYLSITSLAENCGVSEASITRFCRSLGLSGYNELKLDLAKTVYVSDSPENKIADGDSPANFLETTCKKLRDSYMVSLNDTIAQIDPNAFERAADLLYHARNVYCFGQGGSMVIAMEAWALFGTISPKFVHIADSHVQMMTTSLCTSEDVILFFSYSGNTREGRDRRHNASGHSVPVILVRPFI
ncbi:MAG: MurR/RpiR family transcriptional regulator, partial [Lachnospiraceae bacterium]|nr:MurR/RpiR family transcriptional regulator [Lachnospiraceae bacterium]